MGKWVKEVEVLNDEYVINDSITGQWVKHVEASHPMHIDSSIIVDITKLDDKNCDCNFVWTSRIEGGNDNTFHSSKSIRPNYGDDGIVSSIEIGYDSGNGYIKITSEGLVYDSAFSANSQYLLTKGN